MIILCISFLAYASCNDQNKIKDTNKFLFSGKWTFIESSAKDIINYAEIDFKSNSTLEIYSETNGKEGPFQYSEMNNTLTFNNIDLLITSDSNGFIRLSNLTNEFLLYKIPFDDENLKSNQIDPFYLRRCYYLVQLNYITTNRAIDYLSDLTATKKDSISNDEIIFSNTK